MIHRFRTRASETGLKRWPQRPSVITAVCGLLHTTTYDHLLQCSTVFELAVLNTTYYNAVTLPTMNYV